MPNPNPIASFKFVEAQTTEPFLQRMFSSIVGYSTSDYASVEEGFGQPNKNHICEVRNIPLQKWTQIVYVLDNRNVDLYVDGKLERSCQLPGIPLVNKEPLRISPMIKGSNPGFYGQYANFRYHYAPLTTSDVATLYSEGPEGY